MHKHRLPLFQTHAVVFKVAVALTMRGFIFIPQIYGRRGYAPKASAFLISDIDIFIRRI